MTGIGERVSTGIRNYNNDGHGDRYIGSLFRVDAPVPDDFAWASEPIEFGSAFVSIYGKASSCALFLTSRNLVFQNLEKWNRQVSGSTLFHL